MNANGRERDVCIYRWGIRAVFLDAGGDRNDIDKERFYMVCCGRTVRAPSTDALQAARSVTRAPVSERQVCQNTVGKATSTWRCSP